MTNYSVDFTELNRAADALTAAKFGRIAGTATGKVIRASVNVIRKNVRAELRPHNKTGRMRDRIRTRIRGRGLGTEGGVRATARGTNLIVGGVSQHSIAVGKVMPMWMGKGAWKGGKGAGVTGFAMSVEHPGFGADPFVDRGIEKSMPQVTALIQQAADSMVKTLADQMEGKR